MIQKLGTLAAIPVNTAFNKSSALLRIIKLKCHEENLMTLRYIYLSIVFNKHYLADLKDL